MVAATAMWSIAGVVTRMLESVQSFELTFWRSFFTAICLFIFLRVLQGPGVLQRLVKSPKQLWLSGLCWSVMFTAFMVALTLASVAEVLVTMSVGPLLTALVARVFYKQSIHLPTWLAIVIAGAGMFWMYAEPPSATALSSTFTLAGLPWGTLIGFLVPTAAAVNWCVVQQAQKTGYYSGGGNSFPMYGTGQTVYGQLGYMFKKNLLGEEYGTLMPYASMQYNKLEALSNNVLLFDAGLN